MGDKGKLAIILLSSLLAELSLGVEANIQTPSRLDNVRVDEYNRVMLFLQDPNKYFYKIVDIKNAFNYINLNERGSQEPFFEGFLCKHFAKVNKRKASILIHLLYLDPVGDTGYTLINHIIKLFNVNPRPFIYVLEKRKDWFFFVNAMKAGDWMEFVGAVRSLSKSGFEGELKRYVLK